MERFRSTASGVLMATLTSLTEHFECYQESDLLDRLTNGLQGSDKEVVFLVGSALTAPSKAAEAGVPGVDGIIKIIQDQFESSTQEELARLLSNSNNKYQDAFRFLLGRRGLQKANEVIRRAVAAARHKNLATYTLSGLTSDDACRGFDADVAGWSLSPGVKALGELASNHRPRFGRTILTTNFDPLIGVSIAAAGGSHFRSAFHRDGNIGQSDGNGSHVVHLHGYWHGSDTLHTPRQLNQPRPQLRSSLTHLIRDKIVVIVAYGGWDDAFTQAVSDVVLDDNAYPEIIWCFHEKEPKIRKELLASLEPGINRERVTLYAGIDCHSFLPALSSQWPKPRQEPLPDRASGKTDSNQTKSGIISVSYHIAPHSETNKFSTADEDRPPQLDFYVGRQRELERVQGSNSRVVFITGIGGQGKSALAANIFDNSTNKSLYAHRLWRDCKEQRNKFEDHIANIIRSLSGRSIAIEDISSQPPESLADLFCELTKDLSILVVFDNVDHYIDLEYNKITGTPGVFLQRFLQNESRARLIFTCRPSIRESHNSVQSIPLEGLTLDATRELFALRRADAPSGSLERAHAITGGHPFWLDLIAAQIAKRQPSIQLDAMLDLIPSGKGEIPDKMLLSIWQGLQDREKIVLQALAETLRPTSELSLSDYIGSKLNYNKMTRALRSLRGLNLLVVKSLDNGGDGFELHPVIRAFIRGSFKRDERIYFIDAILSTYRAFFRSHRNELAKKPVYNTLLRWLEGAELCINRESYSDALDFISEIDNSVTQCPGEFVRVVFLLFSNSDIKELAKHDKFDSVFTIYARILSNFGRTEDASEALGRYLETLAGKDARYINYCNMQAYMHWINGNFVGAIKWGSEGDELKKSSGVDTGYSSAHNLALAQRDSGAIDPALDFFLYGAKIDDVITPDAIQVGRKGAYYGNIGRCLHLMGQIDPALICYRKSAYLVENEIAQGGWENQAYIRQWIGELLLIKADTETALHFLVAALSRWRAISPPKERNLEGYMAAQTRIPREIWPDEAEAEAAVVRWISEINYSSTTDS